MIQASRVIRPQPRQSLPKLTIRTASRLLKLGLIRSEELSSFCYNLAVAGEEIWNLNAFYRLVSRDDLLENARASDERRKHGKCLSNLDGIPISMKANLAVATEPLTAGSKILGHNYQKKEIMNICGYDSDAARILLRDCGALLIGITNMDEFGMGSLGTNVNIMDDDNQYVGNQQQQQKQRPTRNPQPYMKHLWKTILQTTNVEEEGNNNNSGDHLLVETILRSAEQIETDHWHVLDKYYFSNEDGDDDDSNRNDNINNNHNDNDNNHNNCNNDNNNHRNNDKPIDRYYYSAGGSSCGSAASVAHGSSLGSIGTDTGGSIRLPAAWCGIVGLKPSYGLISRHGVVSYASSFDTVGILAKSVDCATILLDKLAQRRQQPSSNTTTSREPIIMDSNSSLYSPSQSKALALEAMEEKPNNNNNNNNGNNLSGITIGIPEAFSIVECPLSLRETWSNGANQLREYGATIQIIRNDVISHEVLQKCLAAYYVLVSAEASSNLARYDGFRYGSSVTTTTTTTMMDNAAAYASGEQQQQQQQQQQDHLPLLQQQYAATRSHGFGIEVIRRVLCGTAVLSSDKVHTHYEAAATLRAILVQQFHKAFDENHVDFLFIPTTLFPSPCPIGVLETRERGNNTTMHASLTNNNNNNNHHLRGEERIVPVDSTEMFANDIMTVPISLSGLPAISIPLKLSSSSSSQTTQLFPTAGFQLVGPRLQEASLLRVAKMLKEHENANEYGT